MKRLQASCNPPMTEIPFIGSGYDTMYSYTYLANVTGSQVQLENKYKIAEQASLVVQSGSQVQ